MLRVLFVIRSLDAGGTERQVVELLRGLDPTRVHPTLLTFYSGGELEDEVRALPHVVLASLGKRGRWDLVGWMPALRRILKAARPDVVHGYLGFPNLLALVAGRLTGAAVVWGLRSSFMDLARYDRLARVEFWLARACSRFADALVVNSDRGRQYLTAQGFAADRLVTIRNGIDVARFRPDPAGRVRVREAWAVADRTPLVGLVARLDPMKDHETFLEAAAEVVRRRHDVRFACVGSGPADYLEELASIASRLGLCDRVRFEPARQDLAAVYSALDVSVLSSYGEGFPNVVAEAMACGTPCVVTDVGDAAFIVGDMGTVVAPRRPADLAEGILRTLQSTPGSAEGRRRRIEELFGSARLVEEMTAVLECVGRQSR